MGGHRADGLLLHRASTPEHLSLRSQSQVFQPVCLPKDTGVPFSIVKGQVESMISSNSILVAVKAVQRSFMSDFDPALIPLSSNQHSRKHECIFLEKAYLRIILLLINVGSISWASSNLFRSIYPTWLTIPLGECTSCSSTTYLGHHSQE